MLQFIVLQVILPILTNDESLEKPILSYANYAYAVSHKIKWCIYVRCALSNWTNNGRVQGKPNVNEHDYLSNKTTQNILFSHKNYIVN